MKKPNLLSRLAGVALLALTVGCATQRDLAPTANRLYKNKDLIITKDSTDGRKFDFDECIEKTAKTIEYKEDVIPYTKTAEQAEKSRVGDCKTRAEYFSKLVSDKHIYNELVFGNVLYYDGKEYPHEWNRVVEDGVPYIVDTNRGLRLREDEVPDGLYTEFCSIKPSGYRFLDVQWDSLRGQFEFNLGIARKAITGDPKEPIFKEIRF